MDRFAETLSPKLSEETAEQIAKEMVVETQMKKNGKSKLDLTRYDWARVQFADLRDRRNTQGDCQGSHQVEPFGRGSLSGTNKHGIWLVCARCRLRVVYAPTWGAKGCYRSAGPLAKDVSTRLEEMKQIPESERDPNTLKTQVLALDAAESSAVRRVEEIRKEKERAKAKAKPKMSPQKTQKGEQAVPESTAGYPKKTSKRENSVTPEVQELENQDGWTRVGP